MRYSTVRDAARRVEELQGRMRQLNRDQMKAARESNVNMSYTSFAEEWDDLNKPGAHGGASYIALLRRTGKKLMKARAKRDAWLVAN